MEELSGGLRPPWPEWKVSGQNHHWSDLNFFQPSVNLPGANIGSTLNVVSGMAVSVIPWSLKYWRESICPMKTSVDKMSK